MKWLYLEDSYLREFDAEVIASNDRGVRLDRSAFYPGGGGQPHDTGRMIWSGGACRVVGMDGEVHLIDGPKPVPGTEVRGIIDWERRHRVMRAHTALHVIAGVAFEDYGVTITGNQLYEAAARMDLSFENMTRDLAEEIISKANEVISRNLQVMTYYIDRKEFRSRPDLMRVAPHLYEKYERIRIVEIGDFDAQADGGTHVRNTSEIGTVVLTRYQSKGKRNKRIYVELRD